MRVFNFFSNILSIIVCIVHFHNKIYFIVHLIKNIMGNVVTLMMYKNTLSNDCYMTKWCNNAAILSHMFNTTTTIITNNERIEDLCPHARILHIDQRLDKILRYYDNYIQYFRHGKGYLHRVYLHKLAILNPDLFDKPVIFLDTDVDVSIGREGIEQFLVMNPKQII